MILRPFTHVFKVRLFLFVFFINFSDVLLCQLTAKILPPPPQLRMQNCSAVFEVT